MCSNSVSIKNKSLVDMLSIRSETDVIEQAKQNVGGGEDKVFNNTVMENEVQLL